MSEYVIINKTDIEKRITELETLFIEEGEYFNSRDSGAHAAYKKTLSQSIPLITEIEKAYEAGKLDKELSLSFDNPKGRFIANLKFDV